MLTTRRFSIRSITDRLMGLDDDLMERAFLQAYHNRESRDFYSNLDPYSVTQEDIDKLEEIAMSLLHAAHCKGGELDIAYYATRNVLSIFIKETAKWFLSDPSFITAMLAFVDVVCCYDSIFITYDGRNLLEDKRECPPKTLRKPNHSRSYLYRR